MKVRDSKSNYFEIVENIVVFKGILLCSFCDSCFISQVSNI